MPDAGITHRSTHWAPTVRGAADGTPDRFFEGYAAKFNVESSVLFDDDVTDEDGDPIPFVEVIDANAFDRTLRENPDVRALYNHDSGAVLGRTKSGTLALSTDTIGLAFKDEIPDTQAGRDARVGIKRGDIDGCSFGFCVVKDRVELRPGKPALRTLLDVDLFEVTLGTAFPAYDSTEVALRAMARHERKAPAMDLRIRHQIERERLGLADY